MFLSSFLLTQSLHDDKEEDTSEGDEGDSTDQESVPEVKILPQRSSRGVRFAHFITNLLLHYFALLPLPKHLRSVEDCVVLVC